MRIGPPAPHGRWPFRASIPAAAATAVAFLGAAPATAGSTAGAATGAAAASTVAAAFAAASLRWAPSNFDAVLWPLPWLLLFWLQASSQRHSLLAAVSWACRAVGVSLCAMDRIEDMACIDACLAIPGKHAGSERALLGSPCQARQLALQPYRSLRPIQMRLEAPQPG